MNIFEEIKKELTQHGVNKPISEQTRFKDLNLDSLDLMGLIIKLENKLNLKVPDDQLMEIQTVEDLMKVIDKLKN